MRMVSVLSCDNPSCGAGGCCSSTRIEEEVSNFAQHSFPLYSTIKSQAYFVQNRDARWKASSSTLVIACLFEARAVTPVIQKESAYAAGAYAGTMKIGSKGVGCIACAAKV